MNHCISVDQLVNFFATLTFVPVYGAILALATYIVMRLLGLHSKKGIWFYFAFGMLFAALT